MRTILVVRKWMRATDLVIAVLSIDWGLVRINRKVLAFLLCYAQLIFVPTFGVTSVLGFCLVAGVLSQV
jgi:hypothetical protein